MAHSLPFLRERFSIQELQRRYEAGNKRPLENVLWAFKYMQELDFNDKQSYFYLAGFHGLSANGFPQGFCHHNNVLFPIWHRAYLLAFELSMQEQLRKHNHEDWESVGLPFLDSCSEDFQKFGLPSILTADTVELGGKTVKNPLKSYVLPTEIIDNDGVGYNYSHSKGHETVRYPFSSITAPPEEAAKADAHNARMKTQDYLALLNQNVRRWVKGDPDARNRGVSEKFRACLQAPDYTTLSNRTSASEASRKGHFVISLESPHNDLHVAIGGFTAPDHFMEDGIASGTNGDMGSTNVASFDPIFWLHHCFVDYTLWKWQVLHSATLEFDIDVDDPGAIGERGEDLNMKSPLRPFQKPDGQGLYTPADLIDIITLGYAYGDGSLDKEKLQPGIREKEHGILSIGFSRAQFEGSVVVYGTAVLPTKEVVLGHETILSRFNMSKCENCMVHIDCRVNFHVSRLLSAEEMSVAKYRVDFQYHKLAPGLADYTAIQYETKLDREPFTPVPPMAPKFIFDTPHVDKYIQSLPVCCPRGHPLLDVGTAQDDGWLCDARSSPGGCKSGITGFRQTKGMHRWHCKTCDYDLCPRCYNARKAGFLQELLDEGEPQISEGLCICCV